jgi:hypothetical protein
MAMGFVRGTTRSHEQVPGSRPAQDHLPGKQTLVEQLPVQRLLAAGAPVQAKAGADAQQDSEAVREAANHGTSGTPDAMPHLAPISESFGRHDVSGIQAHTDAAAAEGATAMGAEAFAVGNHVAFGRTPSLHTAAHEAAHVVQQRGGVQLAGGVGAAGDQYEQHADAVADLVVQGKSAEPLLDQHAGPRSAPGAASRSGASGGVQRKNLEQANLSGGLTDKGERLPIVGNNKGFTGRVYAVTAGGTAADRTQALVVAAAQNAQIGARLAGTNWQGAKDNFDQAKYKELDPFFLEVTVNFTHDTKPHQLLLRYQHAAQFNGYIVALKDTSNETLQVLQPMDVPQRSTDPLREGFKYSNRHDQTDGSGIAGLTSGGEEKHVDAYTKIAGEGARWQCVRKHVGSLKNETRFFTKNPVDEQTVFAITFDKLWLNWKTGFKNKYDIPDLEVAQALRSGGTLEVARGAAIDLSTLTENDYNLDTGAGHVVAS